MRTRRSHSPLERAIAFVTLASRDPTPCFFWDNFFGSRPFWGVCSGAVDRRKKEESARRNAGRRVSDAIGNAGADCETETGEAEIEIEEKGDADAYAESESEETSS